MPDLRTQLAEAVQAHGASAIAKALEMPAGTVLSIIAGRGRAGSLALAEQRVARLEVRGLAAKGSGPRAA